MKKIFSLFAAVLFAGSMMAVNFTLSSADAVTVDGVTVTFAKGDGSNPPAWYTNGLRLYANNTVTVSSESAITAITFNWQQQGTKAFNTATASVGEYTHPEAAGEGKWTGSANSVTFTLGASGQLLLNTFTVTLDEGVEPVEPTMDYYVAGSMTNWGPMAAYKLAANPANEGEYMGEFTFAANDEFKVGYSDGTTIESTNYFPNGIDNNYVITEAGDYTVYFRPDGQGGEDWHEGYINAVKVETPVLADPTNCAEAAEAALSVAANNELYNDGKEYSITGYVTAIQTAYSSQYNNISFWMADAADGGNVIQAYRAACASAEEAPAVGDKVTVTGKLTKYGSTPEFAAGCTYVIVEKSQIVPQNLGAKTIAEFLALKNTTDTCILTGVVSNIQNAQYGNFDLIDATDTVYVYGLLTPAGESRKFADLNVAEKDTLTVLAIYNEYNGNPQAKNAIFVSVKKAPAQDIEITLSSLTNPGALIWTDYVAEEGWWQIMGANEAFDFSISNVRTTETAGVYTIDDLDADYSYIDIYGENDTIEVTFVDGSVTVAVSAEGIVTVNGTLVGSDGNNYIFNLTYKDPVAENTVNVAISEWELVDDYVATNGLFAVSGMEQTSAYVQLSLWMPDDATEIAGDYTEEDFDLQYFGSYVSDANGAYRIFSATINVAQNEAGDVFVTADLLCYNNTLYKVSTTFGDGIDEVNAAVKATKTIKNGHLLIEKNGRTYNVLGTTIR